MASKTTNYGLNKHSPQDFYNVEARNENWDKIDKALAATDPTKITAKAEPADGDGVMIADSADGGKAKRLLWSNVKAALEQVFGDVRTAISRHIADKSNPHGVTAEQVGALPIKPWSTGTDFNDLTETGIYQCQGINTNTPYGSGDTHFFIEVLYHHSAWIRQTAFDVRSQKIYTRTRRDDNWYDWREILSVDATGTFSKVGVVRTSGAVDPNDISLRPSYILSYDSTPTINGTIMWKYI